MTSVSSSTYRKPSLPLGWRAGRAFTRRGTGSLDLLVSFTLIVTAIGVATPLIVRHGRLLKSHRNYRLALDEVSNHLDRLSSLPVAELPSTVGSIEPSAFIQQRLLGAALTGELQPTDGGSRITLKLWWNEIGRQDAPVTLSAWVFPDGSQSEPEGAEEAER